MIDSLIVDNISLMAIDIETIKRPLTEVERKHAKKVFDNKVFSQSPPKNIKKEETIKKWMEETAEKNREEWIKITQGDSLSLYYSEIVSIAIAYFRNPSSNNEQKHAVLVRNLEQDYSQYIKDAIDMIEGVTRPGIITANGKGFDVPVIKHQCFMHKVNVPAILSNNLDILDYFKYWSPYGGYQTVSLKELTAIFLGRFEEMSGDMVEKLWANQEYEKLAHYNIRDAVNTLDIANIAYQCDSNLWR